MPAFQTSFGVNVTGAGTGPAADPIGQACAILPCAGASALRLRRVTGHTYGTVVVTVRFTG